MFENLSDRIAGTLLVGLDFAVEFATLGELRVVDPDLVLAPTFPTEPGAPMARMPVHRRLIDLADVDRDLLPQPSTALARAAAPAGMPAASRGVVVGAPTPASRPAEAAICEQRRRADSAPRSPKRHPARARAGSVQPPAQLCLLPD